MIETLVSSTPKWLFAGKGIKFLAFSWRMILGKQIRKYLNLTNRYFKKLFSNEGVIPKSQQDLVPHLVIPEEKSYDLLVINEKVRRVMKCLHL